MAIFARGAFISVMGILILLALFFILLYDSRASGLQSKVTSPSYGGSRENNHHSHSHDYSARQYAQMRAQSSMANRQRGPKTLSDQSFIIVIILAVIAFLFFIGGF